MSSEKTWIPMHECKNGYLYTLSSRNLWLGVFVEIAKSERFIGIREKFGNRYLSHEEHWDCGPPYGTAKPIAEICKIPDDIGLFESHPTIDLNTGRRIYFTTPVYSGGKGWCFLDTNEPAGQVDPVSKENEELYKWLEEKEKTISKT